MASLIRTAALVWLLPCAGAASPALAQSSESSRSGEPPLAAWTLTGVDVDFQNWRGVVRFGYLRDVDSRVWITDLTFLAAKALNVLVGYAYVQPTATHAAGTSPARAGATWMPLRRRVTIDNRFLIERRSNNVTGPSIRGRSRLRVSSRLPGARTTSVFGSVEAIGAIDVGVVENRMQLGAAKSVGRLSVEVTGSKEESAIALRSTGSVSRSSIGLEHEMWSSATRPSGRWRTLGKRSGPATSSHFDERQRTRDPRLNLPNESPSVRP
jgi:hypothetical protein